MFVHVHCANTLCDPTHTFAHSLSLSFFLFCAAAAHTHTHRHWPRRVCVNEVETLNEYHTNITSILTAYHIRINIFFVGSCPFDCYFTLVWLSVHICFIVFVFIIVIMAVFSLVGCLVGCLVGWWAVVSRGRGRCVWPFV